LSIFFSKSISLLTVLVLFHCRSSFASGVVVLSSPPLPHPSNLKDCYAWSTLGTPPPRRSLFNYPSCPLPPTPPPTQYLQYNAGPSGRIILPRHSYSCNSGLAVLQFNFVLTGKMFTFLYYSKYVFYWYNIQHTEHVYIKFILGYIKGTVSRELSGVGINS
jgi:hypothetical protein